MQELIRKKREIVSMFLKKGILLDSELLKSIDEHQDPEKLLWMYEQKAAHDAKTEDPPKTDTHGTDKAQEQKNPPKINVVFSYKETARKREPQDFVDYFNNRYRAIEKILKQHQELMNTTSMNKLAGRKDKEPVVVIGMVSDKRVTKNGNLMLVIEDPTDTKKAIINKSKPSLFREASEIVLDETIGITGVHVENVIFVNNIIWPDTPTNKELKKSSDEKFAIFLSDLHVGSSKFLPEDFEKFLKWINGEMGSEQQRQIANNVEYIFIAGDLVDGCGIYPEQDKELSIKDIYEQYRECARLLKQIPSNIPLIICPGNHDALRISEPQPPLSKDFSKPMHELSNAVMVSNPSLINIHSTLDFQGFDVMMYHGYSFDYFVAEVDALRNNGGYDRADLIMKFLLKRRHLAPSHLSTLYLPDTKSDPLVIDRVPDFFLSGHIHKTATSNYRNTTLICGSCWQGKTLFQEKVGHNPEPSRVPIVNLRTRDIKILKFGQ